MTRTSAVGVIGFGCFVLLAASVLAQEPATGNAALDIELRHNTPNERATADRLRLLRKQFDLAPWLFTRRVMVDEQAIPHSHPVLTVGYGDHGDDHLLPSNFVHEELHWWLTAHQEQTNAAMAELRQLFPRLPIGAPDGADNEQSSYLHLLVIYLEWQADKACWAKSKQPM
jgi:hypothetical protein